MDGTHCGWRVRGRVIFIAGLAFLVGAVAHGARGPAPALTAKGSRGPIPLYVFKAKADAAPKAIIIFGSGDGGWSSVETRICGAMADWGYLILGVDCQKYAASDYDETVLAADVAAVVGAAWPASSGPVPPLILGGWSMGAEQSVPAAAALKDPLRARLAGLLLLAPGSRGRFGLRAADRLGLVPSGKGTFALAEYAGRLGNLRVAQFHAGLDLLDSTTWLKGLNAPHRLFTMGRAVHDFGGVSAEFQAMLAKAIVWILSPASEAAQ